MIYRDRKHDSGSFAGQLERYKPDPHPRTGFFELGDPAVGRDAHHKKNAIFTETLDAAIHLIRTYGFSLRMRGNLTNQRNLISANEIEGL
jgi:hypothetical protein